MCVCACVWQCAYICAHALNLLTRFSHSYACVWILESNTEKSSGKSAWIAPDCPGDLATSKFQDFLLNNSGLNICLNVQVSFLSWNSGQVPELSWNWYNIILKYKMHLLWNSGLVSELTWNWFNIILKYRIHLSWYSGLVPELSWNWFNIILKYGIDLSWNLGLVPELSWSWFIGLLKFGSF